MPGESSTSSVPVSAGLSAYAELECRTNFSFLYGASHPEEMVQRAVQLGYSALAITDECSLAGIVRAHVEARQAGLKLIIGSSFQLVDDHGQPDLKLIVLCCNRQGYGNLAELITLARSRMPKGEYCVRRTDFSHPPADKPHLAGMPDCLIILSIDGTAPFDRAEEQLAWAKAVFGDRLWLALTLLHQPQDEACRRLVETLAARYQVPVVATGDVRMHVRSRKPVLDALTAIRLGRPIAECGFELAANAEQHLRSRLRLAMLYPAEALAQTLAIAERCRFSLDELRYEYPEEIVPAGETPSSYLRKQTYLGAQRRFPEGIPDDLRAILEKELALIAELKYEPYFLTVYDIVEFARREGILCQGRGSAANSVVCYCLGITAADPRQTVPLFERFISRERNEPPDIDVDFEHQRREEVIQYIYRKYGRHRAALTAVVITYRSRSALRDTGKALGVDATVIDAVTRSQQWWDGRAGLLRRFQECGLEPASPISQRWAMLAERIMGFPRHLSQHPGGFVIARDSLCRLVPIENAAMPGRSVVQWDKDDLDAMGLLKVDILGLGMLTVLRRTLEKVSWQRGETLHLYQIPPDCPETYAMIQRADTVGTFQIESRAQMSMLPRLKPRCYYDLVVQVAIVRPGPIQGGMVHPYLRRRQGLEKADCPPRLERALGRTLGVPIFQEQAMQVAMIAAGLSPGRADSLRRAMAAWRRKGGIDKFRDELIQGMLANGYDQSFAEAIYRQMEGFGEYGFPESHAASFALLAYASAWLKCHYPQAFLAALLNSQPMGFYRPAQLVQDAARHGVHVLPVDVCVSDWDAGLEWLADSAKQGENACPGKHAPAASNDDPKQLKTLGVRLGLNQVKGLSRQAAQRIEAARAQQAFADLDDLIARARLNRSELQALAAANALRTLVGHRRQAAWATASAAWQRDLLQHAPVQETPPRLAVPNEAQEIVRDYQTIGLTLNRHPLALLRAELSRRGFGTAEAMRQLPNGRRTRACGIVTGRQRPGTAKGVVFVTLEDETGNVNVIVWPDLVERQRRELLGARLLAVYGEWQASQGVHHLIAHRLVDLSPLLGQLAPRSRDFH